MREHFQHLDTIPEQKLLDGIYAKMVHMAGTSVAHVRLEKGAVLPEHQHVHEQVTNVLSGELEMTVAGKTHTCKAGDIVVLPSNTPHAARAITEVQLIDVFQPVREDYKL